RPDRGGWERVGLVLLTSRSGSEQLLPAQSRNRRRVLRCHPQLDQREPILTQRPRRSLLGRGGKVRPQPDKTQPKCPRRRWHGPRWQPQRDRRQPHLPSPRRRWHWHLARRRRSKPDRAQLDPTPERDRDRRGL